MAGEICEHCSWRGYNTPATRAVGWDGALVCDFHCKFFNARLPVRKQVRFEGLLEKARTQYRVALDELGET